MSRAVARALAEDLDVALDACPEERRAADVTSVATVPADRRGDASLVAPARPRPASGAVGAVTHAGPQLDIALDVRAAGEPGPVEA